MTIQLETTLDTVDDRPISLNLVYSKLLDIVSKRHDAAVWSSDVDMARLMDVSAARLLLAVNLFMQKEDGTRRGTIIEVANAAKAVGLVMTELADWLRKGMVN